MSKRFLEELIQRELEFKLSIKELLVNLSKEVNQINSNQNIIHIGYNNTFPLIEHVKQNKFMVLKEEYNDINTLCILINDLIGKDKTMHNKNQVEKLNQLHYKINDSLDENINYLKNLMIKD